ncbi:MAG: FAD-dependent monooxygenase, partial [Burkholderiaceae bacterium]|nr:FAD-dependent monooxygenase [Burkholderiaceae bacterium]
MSSTPLHYNVAICGAGPVGQTLALLLRQAGMAAEKILLIDAKTHQQAQHDARSIALSYGSRQILQSVGAWSSQVTPIQQIHVSRRGHFGRCLIDAEAYHLPALGYVARYGDIIAPLQAQVVQATIAQQRPLLIQQIIEDTDDIKLHATNGDMISADMVVQAEGGLFAQEQTQNLAHKIQQKNYQQTAIVTQISSAKGSGHCAFERFTEQGPLALLPQDNGYALVWCVHADHADQLMAMNDNDFLSALQQAFGGRLGQLISSGTRHRFPLGLQVQEDDAPDSRLVRIGNAAQILHPVAGQGLNLGLRDALILSKNLARLTPSSRTPHHIKTTLQEFRQQRQADRSSTIKLTD